MRCVGDDLRLAIIVSNVLPLGGLEGFRVIGETVSRSGQLRGTAVMAFSDGVLTANLRIGERLYMLRRVRTPTSCGFARA